MGNDHPISKVAKLARLDLSKEELAEHEKQLDSILGYVSKLKSIDVDGVEPMARPAEVSNVFREDIPRPSLSKEEALRSAPDKNDDFFIVPKVVE